MNPTRHPRRCDPEFFKVLKVIAPSFGKRFSGINASMLAVIPAQSQLICIAATGFHVKAPNVPTISFLELIRYGRCAPWKIWHARRNIDMLVGLILKYVFRFKLLLIFTSAAQRKHTAITRFYYRYMEEIITPTAAAAAYLTRSATVIPHGIDPTRFFRPENRAREWAKKKLPGRYGIGLFGRIRPDKGTREFVEAAIQVLKKNPDWTVVIFGKTTPENIRFERDLRSLIKKAELENRIIFMGFIQDSEAIPRWLRALSITACTSHNEGFGLSCIEAMASGCPVIATQTGVWPEIIQHEKNGILIPAKDSEALAQAFDRLIQNPEQREALANEASTTVLNHYQIKDEAEGIQTVYQRVFSRYAEN